MKKRDIYLFIILIIAIFGIHITNNNYYEFNNKTEQYTSKVISKLSYESYIQPILTKNNIDIFLSEFSDDIEEININIEQLKSDLNRAKTELTTAISNNEAEIDAKIAALNTAIENAEEAANYYSDEQDAALKAELLDLINTTKTDIIKYIDSELAKAKTSFESKLAMKANKPEIAAEIARLDSLISAAESVSKSYTNEQDAALKEELVDLINTTKTDIIQYIDSELAKAKTSFESKLAMKANKPEIDAEIARLDSLISAAESVSKTYTDEQDDALKEELVDLINTTKTDIIKYIDEELSKVNEDLDNIFNFVYNESEVDAKLAEIRTIINSADEVTKLYSDEQDAALKEELKNLITTTKTDIIKYIDEELSKVNEELDNIFKFVYNKAEIDAKLAALRSNIENAEKATKLYSDEQDAALKEELKNLITTTKTDIIKYIDEELSKVNEKLDNIFNFVYNESEVDAKLAELRSNIENAEKVTKLYSDEQDAALKEELKNLVTTTKTDIIKYIDEELSKVNEELDNIFRFVYNKAEIDAKLAALSSNIEKADEVTKLYSDEQDAALKEELKNLITTIKTDIIKYIDDELAKAKTSFESKLAIKANKPEIDAEIARLDALISAAESVSKTYTDEQDAALKEELKNLITTTKTDIIKYIDEELSKVNDELDNIFNLVYNESEVDAKLAELRTFINSADNATKLYSDEQDAALKEELEDLINTTKTDIIKYIDEELSKVNEDLDNIFNSVYNENEVDAKLAELRTIIDNADKATKLYSDEQDIAIKKDLEAKILSVKNELLETINLINQRISKFDHDLLNLKKKIQILTISFSCCIGVLFILFGFLFVYFYKKNKKFIKKL